MTISPPASVPAPSRRVTIDHAHAGACDACGRATARRVNGVPLHAGLCETIARTRRA